MQHRNFQALAVLLGALPAAVVTLVVSLGAAVVLPSPIAHAAGGQCKWEGGAGAPTYQSCLVEDCVGRGGMAQCTRGVGAVQSGLTDAQVGPDKWVYGGVEDYYNPTFTNPYYCAAAGGTWGPTVPGGVNYTCLNLPADILGGGGRTTNSQSRVFSIAKQFADDWLGRDPSCGPSTIQSDTNWGVVTQSLGTPISSSRNIVYAGTGCASTILITFTKTRAARCAPPSTSRNATTGAECFIPADVCLDYTNPVSVLSGAKYQKEIDYSPSADTGLQFVRHYKSAGYYWPTYLGGMSAPDDMTADDFWSHSYQRRFIATPSNSYTMAVVRRPNCSLMVFDTQGNEITNRGGVNGSGARLQTAGGGWDLTLPNSDVEHYDSAGRLVTITGRNGRVTTLAYGGNGKLSTVTGPFGHAITLAYMAYGADQLLTSVTLPDAGVITYAYDQYLRPVSVTYPDGKSRQYEYADVSNRWQLTGIFDETGGRFSTYTYDTAGHVTSESHAGNANIYTFNYGGIYGQPTTVTDPLGAVTQFGMVAAKGAYRRGSFSQPCLICDSTASTTYDANGNPATETDFDGHQTVYTFDTNRNLETARTEASGTPRARTISTTWHSTFRLPTQIDEPGRRTTHTYDGNGNVLTRTVTDTTSNASRTWTYTYNGFGQVLSIDGPRTDVSDVTVFTYYSCTSGAACGQLATVTDAAGNITSYTSYNAHGQRLSMTDPNGTITTFGYDARQRLTSRSTAGEVTAWEYWPTGLLKKVTKRDGSFAVYDYDAAHRLMKITDTAGNTVNYTLDGAGNRTAETVRDASNTVVLSKTRTFNSLGRVVEDNGAANQTTSYTYNGAGQVIETNDPFGRTAEQAYDELGRLTSITDPALGLTQLAYDGVDNLVSVTDPRALVTSYAYNGLGDQTGLTSPDTGATGHTYDAAGNLDLATDARSKTGDYSYDPAGRVSGVAYSDQTIAFMYDQGSTGHGQLTQLVDGAGTTQWSYDSWGRVTSRAQTTGSVTLTVGYSYDTAGRLASLTTPSGRTVGYTYDTSGRVSSLTVNATTLLSGVTYQPFGPITGWQWGNGTSTQRAYDTDGQLTSLSSAGSSTFTYFPDGRIQSRTDDFAGAAPPSTGTATFTTASTSNRVQSVAGLFTRTYSYDAAGHTTSDGGRTFTYNDAGRMKTSTAGGVTTTYSYNGLGERVKKTNANVTAYFAYDEAGHLVGEYDGSGTLIEETLWLNDIPVATVRPSGGSSVKVYYVHTDQLNTPRRVTDPATNTVIWRWESDPFGATAAAEDPDGDTVTFTYNLRFPGQYYDAETALNYNYFRDYDPVTGRYVESDPTGLGGGINTFAYATGDPLSYSDPQGLFVLPLAVPVVEGLVNTIGMLYVLLKAHDAMEHNSDPPAKGADIIRFPSRESRVDMKQCRADDPDDPCTRSWQQLKEFYTLIRNAEARILGANSNPRVPPQEINQITAFKRQYNVAAETHNLVCPHKRVPLFQMGPVPVQRYGLPPEF
jgi:RHS repeat-associated protein